MSSGRFQIEELQHGAEIIPPSLPPTGVFTPGGETPQGSSPLMFCHVLINAHISSFLVCFNDKHVPCGNLVTFSKYC